MEGVEEPCRGREREDRGNSWDERTGAGGGKRGMPAFLFKLPGEANTNKQHRTAQGGAREGGGGEAKDPIQERQKREWKAWVYMDMRTKNLI